MLVPFAVGAAALATLIGGGLAIRRWWPPRHLAAQRAEKTLAGTSSDQLPDGAWVPNPTESGPWAEYAPLGPSDTTLAPWPGLEKFGWTQRDRRHFEAIARRHGQSPNALAAVLNNESGLNPKAINWAKKKKTGSKYPVAAGLFQITKEANRPIVRNRDDLLRFAQLPIAEQLDELDAVLGLQKPRPGSTPGELYMLNFLPALAYSPDNKIVGQKNGTEKLPGGITTGAVFNSNPGLSKDGDRFTIGDVKASIIAAIRRTFKKTTRAAPPIGTSAGANPILNALQGATLSPTDARWPEVVRKDLWNEQQKQIGLGTTCLDYLGWILEKAGLSKDAIEPHGRWRTGARFSRLVQQKNANVKDLAAAEPGDAFELRSPTKKSNFHVGFFVSLSRVGPDRIEAVTQDGGQGTRTAQEAKQVKRVFVRTADGAWEQEGTGRAITWILKTHRILA